MRSNKSILVWLLTGCLLVYAMVVIGGMTRLTHSGLSMVEWKPTGSLPPMNDEEWNAEFEKYKQFPEYKILNSDFTLSDFKSIYWWEYIHRFLGRTIGAVFLIPFFWFWIRKKFPEGFLKKMFVLLLIGAGQGLLGWFMVQSGLVKNPAVSHYRLAAHLITAFTAFGFTFWYALDLIYDGLSSAQPGPMSTGEGDAGRGLKRLALILFSVIVIQIIYGAFVAGLKAGYSYPTFPKMGDKWIPDEITALEPAWRNFTEGAAGVQFLHRYIAVAVVILVSVLFFKARKLGLTSLQRKLVNALVIIVAAQFLLGLATLLYGVPVLVAVLHQTGAFFLFATSLFFIHSLGMQPQSAVSK